MSKNLSHRLDENGFTLVELLVVILIVGILAAVAVPSFLNQRRNANDAAVESDMRNVATKVEELLISDPNATHITVEFDYSEGYDQWMEDNAATLPPFIESSEQQEEIHSRMPPELLHHYAVITVGNNPPERVKLSDGVMLTTSSAPVLPVLSGPNYVLFGSHENGNKYDFNAGFNMTVGYYDHSNHLIYSSLDGGLLPEPLTFQELHAYLEDVQSRS